MNLRHRFRPRLEQFEDSIAPAVNLLFDGANLAIAGDPSALTITQNPADVRVSGTDSAGAFDFGPYPVTGNINVVLSNAIGLRTVTLAMGANTAGQLGSVVAGGVLLALVSGWLPGA